MSLNANVDEVVSRYKDGYNYYRSQRDSFVTYYKKYRGWLDANSTKDFYKWRSKLFIPSIGRAVDGLTVNLWLAIFSMTPFFEVKPREESDVARSKAVGALLEYQFEETSFKTEFLKFLIQLGIYGTSFGKVYQKTIKKKVKRRRPKEFMGVTFPGEFELKEEEEVVYDGPCFQPIDIFDIVVSPNATSLEDTWVIHRSEKTLGEIKKMQKDGIYKNVDDLELLIMGSNPTEQSESKERKHVGGFPSAWGKEEGDDRRVEILEYHNMERTKIITVGGQSVELRNKENKLYIDPFVHANLWGVPFELYGIGIAEKAGDLQDQLNAEVNSRLDNRNLKQNFILKVRRGANVNTRSLISRPGAVWLTDDIEAIQAMTIPDVASNTSFAEENLLKQEIEEITGVTKYATGGGAETSKKTATEVSVMTRSTSKSFALFVDKIVEQAIKPVVKKFYTINELFMEDETVVRILGQEGMVFVALKPEDIMGNFDFIPAASSQMTDMNLKSQNLINLLGIAKDDPTLNRQTIYKKFWEANGYKDYNELFASPGLPQNPQTPQNNSSQPGGAVSQGGMPVEPTDMRPGTPFEGGTPITVGGGGTRPPV